MKKQFVIKSGQVLKKLAQTSAKTESTSLLNFNFLNADSVCCAWNEGFIVGGLIENGQYTPSKPVFSL